MKPKMRRFLYWAVLLVIVVTAGLYLSNLRNAGKAKKTTGYMMQLSDVLEVKQPPAVDRQSLEEMAREIGLPEYNFTDGWERAIEIEIVDGGQSVRHYRIRSLGRDGQRGECCRGDTDGNWDEDAVLEAGEWLQYW